MSDEKDPTTVWDQDGAGGDVTEIDNPVLDYEQHCETEVAPTAWSDYQEDKPVREGLSWKQVCLIAAAILTPIESCAHMGRQGTANKLAVVVNRMPSPIKIGLAQSSHGGPSLSLAR